MRIFNFFVVLCAQDNMFEASSSGVKNLINKFNAAGNENNERNTSDEGCALGKWYMKFTVIY